MRIIRFDQVTQSCGKIMYEICVRLKVPKAELLQFGSGNGFITGAVNGFESRWWCTSKSR